MIRWYMQIYIVYHPLQALASCAQDLIQVKSSKAKLASALVLKTSTLISTINNFPQSWKQNKSICRRLGADQGEDAFVAVAKISGPPHRGKYMLTRLRRGTRVGKWSFRDQRKAPRTSFAKSRRRTRPCRRVWFFLFLSEPVTRSTSYLLRLNQSCISRKIKNRRKRKNSKRRKSRARRELRENEYIRVYIY